MGRALNAVAHIYLFPKDTATITEKYIFHLYDIRHADLLTDARLSVISSFTRMRRGPMWFRIQAAAAADQRGWVYAPGLGG